MKTKIVPTNSNDLHPKYYYPKTYLANHSLENKLKYLTVVYL